MPRRAPEAIRSRRLLCAALDRLMHYDTAAAVQPLARSVTTPLKRFSAVVACEVTEKRISQ